MQKVNVMRLLQVPRLAYALCQLRSTVSRHAARARISWRRVRCDSWVSDQRPALRGCRDRAHLHASKCFTCSLTGCSVSVFRGAFCWRSMFSMYPGGASGEAHAQQMNYQMYAAMQHQMMMQHHAAQNLDDSATSASDSASGRSDSQSSYSHSGISDRSGSAAGSQMMQQRSNMQERMGAYAGGVGGGPSGGQQQMCAPPLEEGKQQRQHQEEVEIKSGWLFKKAESSWGWRKRWFVLYKSRLAYFSSPDARGVVKTIALNDPRVATVVEALQHELEFRINSYGRSFHLKAVSDGERAQWIFALQLAIKDGILAGDRYSDRSRKNKSGRKSKGSSEPSSDNVGYANIVSGSNASGSGHASGDSSHGSSWSSAQLKRKLVEALPADASGGAPTPALAHSNPPSRDNSQRFQGGTHSADSSQQYGSKHGINGRRSRDGSSHGALDNVPVAAGPDDSGKRVRKDGEHLSRTLSVAGQQAVELTMRYLAHMLLQGDGPFQVHEVVWVIHKSYLNLVHRQIPIPTLTSQFLTSVVLRGLLMKQQNGGSQSWPEVHVNTESVEFHKFSQHVTHRIVGSLEYNLEIAPEALVLPPILLPLLLLIEVISQHGWPAKMSQESYADELISAVSGLCVSTSGSGPVPASAMERRGDGSGRSSSRAPNSPSSQGGQSPLEPRSPADTGVPMERLQTSRSFQDLLQGMNSMAGPSSSGSFQGFGHPAVSAPGQGRAARGGPFAASDAMGAPNSMPHGLEVKQEHNVEVEHLTPPFTDETGGLEMHGGDLLAAPEDIAGVLGEQEGDIWDVFVDPDGGALVDVSVACVRAGHCQLSVAVSCVRCALLAADCARTTHGSRCYRRWPVAVAT